MATHIAPSPPGTPEHAPGSAPGDAPEIRGARRYYLDNLKIVLIAGVIVAHAATRFVGSGAWLSAQGVVGKAVIVAAGAVVLIGTLFWVGLFFLMSGWLVPSSLDQKGAGQFIHDRLIRLGVPFAVFMLVVIPVLDYSDYVATHGGGHEGPLTWLAHNARNSDAGPLWFVAALLVYSIAYALWSTYRPHRDHTDGPLRARHLAIIAMAIAVSSFVVRLVWPLYSRQFFDLHLWQWPQYIIMFWFGAVSARRGWLRSLPDRLWRRCGLVALAAALAVPALGVIGGGLNGDTAMFEGGLHWQALALDGIEGILAVTGALWVLELFRRYIDFHGPLLRTLERSAYGAFVLQAPIVVGIGFILRPLALPFEIKFLILAFTGIVASFGLAWLLVVRLRIAARIL